MIDLSERPLNEEQLAYVCCSVLKGLVFLHSIQVVHRGNSLGLKG